MSLDRPGDQGDPGSDRPRDRPFPGAPADRPYVSPPTEVRSWDEIRADKHNYKSQSEYDAVLKARREAAAKDKDASAEKSEPADAPPNADAKPDAHPDETAALRKRIAELEAGKTCQDRKLARQDAEISQLKIDKAEQAAEIAGLKTELGDRKAADTERDWKDRVRDDKIAEQAQNLEDLKAAFLKERGDKQPDKTEGRSENGEDGEESTSAVDRHEHDETNDAADRARPTRKWHLPSNTKMSLISSVIGEAAAADHVPTHPSDYVGIGVATVSLGTAAVATWREHRENRQR